MREKCLLLLFILFTTVFSFAQQPAPVKVDGGLIQGSFEDGLTVYKGIPFAAPPVGNLRWKAPQAVIPWLCVT